MGIAAAALCLLLMQGADPSAEGLKALEAGKYEEALAHFSKATEADPKDYGAQFHLGLALTMLGRDAEAVARYKTVLELKPGLYEAELNLGIVLLRERQPRDALVHLQAAADQKPKEYRPAFYLAEAHFAEGNWEKAEQAYRLAADLDGKSAAAQLGLARSRLKLGRLGEAAENYRRAAEIDGSLKNYQLELAEAYEKQGQREEAIALYAQFPEDAGARERMGELLLEAGKPGEAIPHLEWAVAKSPTPANRVALASAHLRAGHADRAQPLIEQALAAESQNAELRMMYGRVLRDQRKFGPAAAEFAKVASLKPDFVEAWNELAGMLILLEQHPQALAALDRLKALGQETPAHHYFRAIILDKMGQPEPALASYEKFLSLSQGRHPDEEFKARQRARILKKELSRR